MKNIKRIISIALAVITIFGTFAIAASAASSTRKCYTISSNNTRVYSNSGLTNGYGWIYGSDEVTVLSVNSNYTYVQYPVSNGTKKGYIPTSAILTSTSGKTYKATNKVTAYKRPGGASYGYIASGDSVVVFGSSNGYTQVKYPVSGGYKYAWVKGSYPTSSGSSTSNSIPTFSTKIITINSIGTFYVGDVDTLSVYSYGVSSSRSWSSSNSSVVSVNSSGKITCKKAGSAIITVRTSDGYTAKKTISVSAKTTWKTGNFDSGYVAQGYTTVTLNKNAGNANIKICSYDGIGDKSSGKMHITLRSNTGAWIWEGDISSGTTLKLGDNYSQYRVYIAKKSYPNTTIGVSDSFINTGKCVSWSIECRSNCYV